MLSRAGPSTSPSQPAPAPAPMLHAFVVDHGLRESSSHEADQALHLARRLGLQAHLLTLSWPEGRPQAGKVQAEARAARRAALGRACMRHGCTTLLMGHQAGESLGPAGPLDLALW